MQLTFTATICEEIIDIANDSYLLLFQYYSYLYVIHNCDRILENQPKCRSSLFFQLR